MAVGNAFASSLKRATTGRCDSDNTRNLKIACSKVIDDQSFGKKKKGFGISFDKSNVKSTGKEKTTEKCRKSMENAKELRDLREEARVAQRSREEREDERRKRIDELKSRNNERRSRVEERKRLIIEAEKEKRETIIRKNQEAEARIEIRKIQEREKKTRKIVERSKTPVAFGSSTPRPLCHNETTDSFCSSCWSITRDHEVEKTRSSFVGRPRKKFDGVERAEGRSVTPSPIEGNRKPMDRTRHGTPKSSSIYTSSIGLARKASVRSGETTPSSGQSRSSSFTTRYSTTSLDSNGTIGSCSCAILRETTKAIDSVIGNGSSIRIEPDKANRCSRDAKLAPIKSRIPKLLSGRRIPSTFAPVATKKRFEVENSRVRGEENQNLTEIKTMRLANEMLKIEKQRLKLTIEETKRWEEKEQKKQEEIARKRQEKMETERQAREEAERYRNEIAERLKKDSEERTERRKRVQIIMLRTRGENRYEITEESRGRSR